MDLKGPVQCGVDTDGSIVCVPVETSSGEESGGGSQSGGAHPNYLACRIGCALKASKEPPVVRGTNLDKCIETCSQRYSSKTRG